MLLTADAAGGVFTYALELARALRPRGVEVTLALMGPRPTPEQRRELGAAPLERVAESPFALEWMPDAWPDVERAGEWLLEVADETRPDVVHLNGYAHAALAWDAPVVVAAHSDVLSWWEAVRREAAPRVWERYRKEVERGLRAADVVVAPTRAMLEALERHYRFDGERLVIPNARGPRPHAPKEPYVVAVGRFWDEAKNLAALERVAPRLPWPLRPVGNGKPLPVEELEAVVARAAIFAAPARYEPFGLAALEAGLARCALVLGDLASLREVWGDAALYVDPGDDAALERALRRLIEDEPLRTRYAQRAYARARRYTPRRMGDAYLALYRRLAREAVAA